MALASEYYELLVNFTNFYALPNAVYNDTGDAIPYINETLGLFWNPNLEHSRQVRKRERERKGGRWGLKES